MRRIKKGNIVRMRPSHLDAIYKDDRTHVFDTELFINPLRMYKVKTVDRDKHWCDSDCPAYNVCRFRLEAHDNPFTGARDRITLSNDLVYCEADVIKVIKKNRFLFEIYGPDGLTIHKKEKR